MTRGRKRGPIKKDISQETVAMTEHQPARRPKRTPIGTRNILTAPKREGYVRRWVNDTDDRIERFKEAGYEPVAGDFKGGDPQAGDPAGLGSMVTKSVGGGTKAILMEIREDFYREDQAAKHQQIDEIEGAMERQIREQLGGSAIGEGITMTNNKT